MYGSGRVGSGLDGRNFSVDTKPRLDAKRSCEAGRLALRTKAGQRREIDPPKYVIFFKPGFNARLALSTTSRCPRLVYGERGARLVAQ